MRISDWSSDVCSSDLIQPPRPGGPQIVLPVRPGDGYAGTIRCESRNNKQKRCNVRTDNRVDLQRVIGGRCSKGRDWGFTATQIWVSGGRSEEHTSELQSLMRISYAVFCLKKKKYKTQQPLT